MKIKHIYHSGFVIDLEETVLIFDWYEGELPELDPSKKVFVFVTHGHADHYSPRIWELQDKFQNIQYILDCCTAPERKGENVLHVQPGRHYLLRGVNIYAIRTNDQGVAYGVNAEGGYFFHAGDLNIWHWNDSSDQENAYSLKIYRSQLKKISSHVFDAAMVPLDPRLEENAPKAIEEFMRTVPCRWVFPMHYWNRRKDVEGYLSDDRLRPYLDRICFSEEMEI